MQEVKNVKELVNAIDAMFEIWDIAIYENPQDCRIASYGYAEEAIKAYGDKKMRSWSVESKGKRVRINVVLDAED